MAGLTEPPEAIVNPEYWRYIGLQRNSIRSLSAEWVRKFSDLERLDVSRQRVESCVRLVGDFQGIRHKLVGEWFHKALIFSLISSPICQVD